MEFVQIADVLMPIAVIYAIIAFGRRWSTVRQLPLAKDLSAAKGRSSRGVIYAFTQGMAPWAKESTRRHPITYLRGILFHLGIVVGFAALLGSPWIDRADAALRLAGAVIVTAGAACGIIGGILRLTDSHLRTISTADDHLSVWLVSLFLVSVAVGLLWLRFIPVLQIIGAITLIYAPASKIRHFIFFYFGRLFFGIHIGRRGIVQGLESHHE